MVNACFIGMVKHDIIFELPHLLPGIDIKCRGYHADPIFPFAKAGSLLYKQRLYITWIHHSNCSWEMWETMYNYLNINSDIYILVICNYSHSCSIFEIWNDIELCSNILQPLDLQCWYFCLLFTSQPTAGDQVSEEPAVLRSPARANTWPQIRLAQRR